MFYRVLKIICTPILYLLFRIQVVGKEKIKKEGAVIVCSNHTSNLDPLILVAIMPQNLYFIAKEELFKVPVLGWFLKSVGVFPVKRGTHDINAIKTCIGILKSNKALGIFPEGTRNKSDKAIQPKAGVITFAARTGSPVLPIAICKPVKFFKRTRVIIGDLITYPKEEYGRLDYEEYKHLSLELMQHIYEMRNF
jgi:1-acyl-sn-glycerol-3-phosphate acyltransferase